MVFNLTLHFLSLSTVTSQFITTPSYSSSLIGGSYFYQLRCSRFVESFYYTSARTNIIFQNSQFSHFLSTSLIFQRYDKINQTFHNATLQVTCNISIFNCQFNYCCSTNGDGGGAIYSKKDGEINLTIILCQFYHCTHTTSSGVLYVQNSGKNSLLLGSCTINNCSASSNSQPQLIRFVSNDEPNPVTLNHTTIEYWYPEPVQSVDGQFIASYSDRQLYTNTNCTIMNKRKNLGFLFNNAKNANLIANYLILDNFYCEYLFNLKEGNSKDNYTYGFSSITIRNLTQNFENGASASVFYFGIK